MVANCACGLPVARRTSWTSDNLGRKFVACKFYNHETRQRGCNTFEWIDEDILDWQRDVVNMLVAEKHRFPTDSNILKSRLVCETYEKDRLAAELEKLKNAAELEKMKMKPCKQHETRQNRGVVGGNEGIGSKFVVICVVVCVLLVMY
ncbi:DNA topoisomerase 3-alpha [Bienertia sinuspersici]